MSLQNTSDPGSPQIPFFIICKLPRLLGKYRALRPHRFSTVSNSEVFTYTGYQSRLKHSLSCYLTYRRWGEEMDSQKQYCDCECYRQERELNTTRRFHFPHWWPLRLQVKISGVCNANFSSLSRLQISVGNKRIHCLKLFRLV